MTAMPARRRLVILLIGLLIYTAALMLVATVTVSLIGQTPESSWVGLRAFEPPILSEAHWWYWCGVPTLIIVVTQLAFVAPVVNARLAVHPHGRPMMLSVIAIAVVAAALSLGLLCALLELIEVWDDQWGKAVVPLLLLVSWGLWSWLFVLFTRKGRDESMLGRLIGFLLAGTLIEVLAVLPIDVLVRRRTDCYCATGTFNALLFALFAAMWLAGPGVLILCLRRRRRGRRMPASEER